MPKLLQAYLYLTLLRLRPQDLPGSRSLLQFAAMAMVLSGCLLLSLKGGLTSDVLLVVGIDMGMSIALIYLGLRITGKPTRLMQTLSALFGSSALLQMLTVPVLLLIAEDPNSSLVSQLAVLVLMLMIMWSITVVGHIVRHAMELPIWGGMILAIGYWILINDLLLFLGLE